MANHTVINGEFTTCLPADDRGFLFGDHVFETMLTHNRTIPLWAWHWRRLKLACQDLEITLPTEELVLKELAMVLNDDMSVVRLTLTRGSSQTGYAIPSSIQTRRVIQVRPVSAQMTTHKAHGLDADCANFHLPNHSLLSGMKHGNRLYQVRLAQLCCQLAVDEILIFREDGRLAEAMASNVIIVHSDVVKTPQVPEVNGVGLQWLIDMGAPIVKQDIFFEEVDQASEIILINATAGVRPIKQWRKRAMTAREVCRRLQAIWDQSLR